MHSRIIVRPPLHFLAFESAPAALGRMIERLEVQYASACRFAHGEAPEAVKRRLVGIPWSRYAADMRHPLSSLWLQRGGGQRHREFRDASNEFEGYLLVRETLMAGLAADDHKDFLSALRRACAVLCEEEDVQFRRAPIGLEPDADGALVRFGDWVDVPDRLEELFLQYRQSGLPTSMKAISAMAVLLNIHPFVDGNGRCSRALFNAIVESVSGASGSYVPLRAALEASDGGFEIRLREAETNGNWAPLIVYFTTVFSAMRTDHATG